MEDAMDYATRVRDDLSEHCDGLGLDVERMEHTSEMRLTYPALSVEGLGGFAEIAVRADGSLFDIGSGQQTSMPGWTAPPRED